MTQDTQKVFKIEDGRCFYEQPDGSLADTPDGNDAEGEPRDRSYTSLKQLAEELEVVEEIDMLNSPRTVEPFLGLNVRNVGEDDPVLELHLELKGRRVVLAMEINQDAETYDPVYEDIPAVFKELGIDLERDLEDFWHEVTYGLCDGNCYEFYYPLRPHGTGLPYDEFMNPPIEARVFFKLVEKTS